MPSHFDLLPPGGEERRRATRYLVPPGSPLVVGVAVIDAAGKPRTFTGRARDVSRSGMAIILPPGDDCGELVGNSRSLRAVVTLPEGIIYFMAAPVYCHPPDEGGAERRYVVGVAITDIGEHDQSLLDDYLGRLR